MTIDVGSWEIMDNVGSWCGGAIQTTTATESGCLSLIMLFFDPYFFFFFFCPKIEQR